MAEEKTGTSGGDNSKYLSEWANDYSNPRTITKNEHLGETNFEAQMSLLNGNAVGTENNDYLDPIPLLNRYNRIYSNLIEKVDKHQSARTDSIKMNIENMDYTLGDAIEGEEIVDRYDGNNKAIYTGLNLLMPQYQRRVEVEDLDKNFWVIGNALDAVLSTLWGPYSLIDVVRMLIKDYDAVIKYLGLGSINDIILMLGDDDDSYQDMYSRFLLSNLKLKIKTAGGERIIDNIFYGQDKKIDRNSSTNPNSSIDEMFDEIQGEILGIQDPKNKGKLYDSDIIISENAAFKNQYVSLSAITDAINDKIVGDSTSWKDYKYSGNKYSEFFRSIDANGNGVLTEKEYNTLVNDSKKDFGINPLGLNELERFKNYRNGADWILNNVINGTGDYKTDFECDNETNVNDYFKKKKALVKITNIQELDNNENGEIDTDEIIRYCNDEFKKIYEEIENNLEIGLENKEIPEYGIDYVNLLYKHYCEINDIVTEKAGEASKIKHYSSYPLKFINTMFIVNEGELKSLNEKYEREDESATYDPEKYQCGYIVNIDIFENLNNAVYKLITGKDKNENEMPDDFFGEKEQQVERNKKNYAAILTKLKDCVFDLNEIKSIKNINFNDKVYVYSLETLEKIAYATNHGDFIINKDYEYTIDEEKGQSVKISLELFDIREDGKIDVFDCTTSANYLKENEDEIEYYQKINNIRKNYLLNEKFLTTQCLKIKKGNSIIESITGLQYLQNIFPENNIEDLLEDKSNMEDIIKKIDSIVFTKKKDYFEILSYIDDVYVPTEKTIGIAQKLSGSGRPHYGYDITPEDGTALKETVNKTNYILKDNILIFLYDSNYYEYAHKNNNWGLYTLNEDAFYTTKQPLIKRTLFNNNNKTHALFVPHNKLFGGEIIQLRLTEKNGDVEHSVVDFDKLINKGEIIELTKSSEKTVLPLYNSFASSLSQYNYRTALFFKDTAPTTVKDDSNVPIPNSLDDWFTNGIECRYFKPIVMKNKQTSGGLLKGLSNESVFNKTLKIRANMLAKHENYVDNSFVSETISVKNISSNGLEPYYSFDHTQAYCAATRHNLVFYSSPSTNEYGQFIHSPLNLLLSQQLRTEETIQPPVYNYNKTTKDFVEIVKSSTTTSNTGTSVTQAKNKANAADVKNMLYRNAYEDRPLCIEAVFGARDVDDYIKPKKLQYIVFEREPGSRHIMSGVSDVEITFFKNGYLNNKDGIERVSKEDTKEFKVKWVPSDVKTNEHGVLDNDLLSGKDVYGYIDLSAEDIPYANSIQIRFLRKNHSDGYVYQNNDEPCRPIISRVYLFGQDKQIEITK